MGAKSRQWVGVVRSQLALLEEELLVFAAHKYGDVWANECEAHFGANYRRVAGDEDVLRKWALFHRQEGGTTLLEEFLAAAPRKLREEERAGIAAELGAWASYWVVKEVRRGESLRLEDLLTGEERTVLEMKASRTLQVGHALCARVLTLPRGSLLGGTFPIAIWGKEPMLQVLVSQGKDHFGRRSDGVVLPAQLRADGELLGIINCWRMMNGLMKAGAVTYGRASAANGVLH